MKHEQNLYLRKPIYHNLHLQMLLFLILRWLVKLRHFSSCEILKYNSPKGEKRRRKRIIFNLEKGSSPKGEKGSSPKGEKGIRKRLIIFNSGKKKKIYGSSTHLKEREKLSLFHNLKGRRVDKKRHICISS